MPILSISFWQYFKLNRVIGIYCLKFCTILFFSIGILIAVALYLTKGFDEDPFTVIVSSALFGYCLAIYIFGLAISTAFQKAKKVFKQYNQIPERIKEEKLLSVSLRVYPNVDPRHYFIEFVILKEKDGKLEFVTELEIKNWLLHEL